MPIESKIKKGCYFDKDSWLVSVLNTGDKLSGHSVLVVEGIRMNPITSRNELFVKQYDIQAELYQEQTDFINRKGKIVEVRCFEGYSRELSIYPSRSYNVNPIKAKEMIKSIEQDIAICEKAKKRQAEFPNYQLVGEGHFLSDIGMGDNCASWSIKKLAIAGYGDGTGKPKPSKVANTQLIARL